MKVRLLHGLDRAEELEKLCNLVACLMKQVSMIGKERDQVIVEASRDAETHWVSLAEAKEAAVAAEKLLLQDAEDSEAELNQAIDVGRKALPYGRAHGRVCDTPCRGER